MSESPKIDLPQGTLDLLILKRSRSSRSTAGPSPSASSRFRKTCSVGQGSLYPALHRLEHKGWIHAEWGASENNRAKFYSLTRRGRKQLDAQAGAWRALAAAMALLLDTP